MKNEFGFTPDHEPVSLYTLENERFRIAVSDYGATLVSFVEKNSDTEIVAGFSCAEDYSAHTAHFGASIGRVANRIQEAQFILDGRLFHVTKNRENVSLHGGEKGFDRLLYHGREEGNSVIFTALSPDGDEGYPGNLQIRIVYTLLENGIRITGSGISDQNTLFGMTNHSYFNLQGSGGIGDHLIRIYGDCYAPNNQDGTSDGSLLSCRGTPFDFTQEKKAGQDFDSQDPQIQMNGGYDHHYAIPGEGMRLMAAARANGLKLLVRSDLPGVHFYTGNFLKGDLTGHHGIHYGKHERLCFEPEFYPNAINYDAYPKPVLEAGCEKTQTIEYLLIEDEDTSSFLSDN